jgi:hypothetical protein
VAPPPPISAARQALLDDIEGERRLQARLRKKLKGRTVRVLRDNIPVASSLTRPGITERPR